MRYKPVSGGDQGKPYHVDSQWVICPNEACDCEFNLGVIIRHDPVWAVTVEDQGTFLYRAKSANHAIAEMWDEQDLNIVTDDVFGVEAQRMEAADDLDIDNLTDTELVYLLGYSSIPCSGDCGNLIEFSWDYQTGEGTAYGDWDYKGAQQYRPVHKVGDDLFCSPKCAADHYASLAESVPN